MYCWLVFLRGVEVLFGYQVNTLCLGSCSMLIPACTCIAKLDACKTIFQTRNFYLLTCVLEHLDAHMRPFRLQWVPWTAGSHALMLVGQCRVGWEESSPTSEPWAPSSDCPWARLDSTPSCRCIGPGASAAAGCSKSGLSVPGPAPSGALHPQPWAPGLRESLKCKWTSIKW